MSERASTVQPWQKASGRLSALKSDVARVEALLQASVAPATKRKYDAYWSRWSVYSRNHGHVALPASADSVAMFLASVAADGSRTNVMSAAASMSWFHVIAGYEAPTKSPKTSAVLAGAKRLLAAPPRRMEPATLSIVRQVVSGGTGATDFARQRVTFYVVIAFFGFLRFSDVRRLRVKHFKFSGHLTLHLPHSKTDQFRQGSDVLIAAMAGKEYCPYRIAKQFIERLQACRGSDAETFVLTNVTRKAGESRVASTCISASTLTAQLRSALSGMGIHADKYSLHSLRAGGATAAAAAHAPRELIKLHGRWKSDCVDGYIQVTAKDRLALSSAIGKVAQ